MRVFLTFCAITMAGCAAHDAIRVETISLEDPGADVGLRPPPDYTPCYSGQAVAYDTNGDGRADRVKVSVEGKDRCYGEDSNHDGRIDTWDVLDDHGQLSRRAQDTNGDGRIDQAWTFDPTRQGCATVALDADGDGKPDPGSPIDICRQLTTPPAAPAPIRSAVPVSALDPPLGALR